MVFGMVFTVVPLRVSDPDVVELFPIVSALVRAEVTSTAPIDSEAVFMLMPAVVADPALANCTRSAVVQAPEAVLGLQLPAVYHAVAVPVLAQTTVAACVLERPIPQITASSATIFRDM